MLLANPCTIIITMSILLKAKKAARKDQARREELFEKIYTQSVLIVRNVPSSVRKANIFKKIAVKGAQVAGIDRIRTKENRHKATFYVRLRNTTEEMEPDHIGIVRPSIAVSTKKYTLK